ncbi:MAG: DUF3800 domain-containing protein [Candidatus Campbellbacteria bacterium]|nr:DUF3800 domain-containing protein [Candidatus Campbellbacteria bacterium]
MEIERLYIDESGNLGRGGRYFVFPVIYFSSRRHYKSWKNLAKKVIKNNSTLKTLGEIKGSDMNYALKKRILSEIDSKGIDFNIWLGIIDTAAQYYKEKYINSDSIKELAFNYTLNRLFQEKITRKISTKSVEVCIDNRNLKTGSKYSLEEYINVESIHNDNHCCESILVKYKNSKKCYGIQLADLIANIVFTKYEYNGSVGLYKNYIKPKILDVWEYPRRIRSTK